MTEGPLVGLVVNQATGTRYAAVAGRWRRARRAGHHASGCTELSSAHRRHLGLPGPPPGLGPVPGARGGVARVLRGGRGHARCLHGGRAQHPLRLGLPGRPADLPRGGRGDGRTRRAPTWSCATHRARRPIVAATPQLAARLTKEESTVSSATRAGAVGPQDLAHASSRCTA